MPRPRKVLDNSTNNITIAKRQQKEQQEAILAELDGLLSTDPPEELKDKKAVETWNRIIPLLKKLPTLCEIDRDNLIGYCNVWSEYCEILEDQKKARKIEDIEIRTKVMTSLTNRMDKVQIAHKRYGTLCGMSLDARLKMATIKTKQEAETLDQKFGVI